MTKRKRADYAIIDFDSTFVTVESLDELARISLADYPHREEKVRQIAEITNMGMEGAISFTESLRRRVALLGAHKRHLETLSNFLLKNISKSVKENKDRFVANAERIYIVSGGFQEFIIPVVKEYNIPRSHIIANTFIFNEQDQIVGFDSDNVMSQKGGKSKAVNKLDLDGRVVVVGDGYTDYQVREDGAAHMFLVFIENVQRDSVVQRADYTVSSFTDFFVNYF